MTIQQEELDRFHQFASQQIGRTDAASIYDLLAQWEAEQLSEAELHRNAQAIQKALDAMETGDKGRPARDVIAELRQR